MLSKFKILVVAFLLVKLTKNKIIIIPAENDQIFLDMKKIYTKLNEVLLMIFPSKTEGSVAVSHEKIFALQKRTAGRN